MPKTDRQHFLVYATANETDFFTDYLNISLMTKYDPGVVHIQLYVVVSEVEKLTEEGERALSLIRREIYDCKWLELRQIVVKGNRGRDFSSVKEVLLQIKGEAVDDDLVMVRNRSAYGPFGRNWFSKYADLFDSSPSIGLAGNTINFSGTEDRSYLDVITHIQTYLYISNWKVFSQIATEFPGVDEDIQIDLVNNGEIVLSQMILKMNLSITCLYWPGKSFDLGYPRDPDLPQHDIKMHVHGLPFLHREALPIYKNRNILIRWHWLRLLHCLFGSKGEKSFQRSDNYYD